MASNRPMGLPWPHQFWSLFIFTWSGPGTSPVSTFPWSWSLSTMCLPTTCSGSSMFYTWNQFTCHTCQGFYTPGCRLHNSQLASLGPLVTISSRPLQLASMASRSGGAMCPTMQIVDCWVAIKIVDCWVAINVVVWRALLSGDRETPAALPSTTTSVMEGLPVGLLPIPWEGADWVASKRSMGLPWLHPFWSLFTFPWSWSLSTTCHPASATPSSPIVVPVES